MKKSMTKEEEKMKEIKLNGKRQKRIIQGWRRRNAKRRKGKRNIGKRKGKKLGKRETKRKKKL